MNPHLPLAERGVHSVARRLFLKHAAALATSGGILATDRNLTRHARAEEPVPSSSDAISGKDPRLIVHSAEPAEIETPLSLLREHAITPAALLFVRNNQSLTGATNIAPVNNPQWRVELTGLLAHPAAITVGELQAMPQVEHELVLQCSGNGRAMFSAAAPAKGAPWQSGAMGNVVFAGVPLTKVLEKLGLQVNARAQFLTAEGRDVPPKIGQHDFEHSIPLADALARSILALSMNGTPIPAAHGGPLRLITPGYYATMNVKWLGRLRFDEQETNNYHQVGRYRTPREPIALGSEFTSTLANSDANWRMRTKSVIFAPLDGQQLPAGKIEIRGVAWNDGAAPIESVLVSTDAGATWTKTALATNKSPYAWQHWTIALELPRGEHTLMARAIDTLGRGQPISPAAHWNPAGYAFHGAHAVRVVVR